jgi:translation initiation factor 3 subunit L
LIIYHTMKSTKNQKDLYIETEDLPVQNLDLLANTLANTSLRTNKEIANEFINKLDEAYNRGNLQHISYLYDYVFNKLSTTVFSNQKWPSATSLPGHKQLKPVVI